MTVDVASTRSIAHVGRGTGVTPDGLVHLTTGLRRVPLTVREVLTSTVYNFYVPSTTTCTVGVTEVSGS